MNEFIVWDNKHKIFIKDISIERLAISEPLKNKIYLVHWDILNYIGIKDINNNKIYADCSSFEFDYIDLNLEDIECGRRTYKGFFSWNQDTLSYFIHYDGGNEFFNQVQYCPAKFENFKIIDTIQENKLGLING